MGKVARKHGHVAALDGLRGVAAFAVLAHHSGSFWLDFHYGYLAVDFFYALSGYVIGMAYEQRLLGNLKVADYFIIRLERLYPMLLLGALLGLVSVQVTPADGYFIPKLPYSLAVAFVAQLLLIPFAVSPGAFFINGPQWSIVFELAVNLFHAAFLPWLRNRALIALLVVNAALLCWIGLSQGGINYGWGADNFLAGIPRVLFGFFAGLLLFRTRASWLGLLPSLPFWALGLFLLVLLAVPHAEVSGLLAVAFELVSIFLLFPFIVALGAKATPGGALGRVLGVMSYPLYAIHQPLLFTASWALKAAGLQEGAAGQLLQAAAALAILAFAYAAGRFIDVPWNQWRKALRKQDLPPGAAKAVPAGTPRPSYPAFRFINIAAALAVALSSSILAATGSDLDDPLLATGLSTSVYGVLVLAVTAGFFAAQSAWQSGSPVQFLANRFWRIAPAFAISTLVIAYAICAPFAAAGPADFLRSPAVLDQVSQVLFLHTDKFYFPDVAFYAPSGPDDYLPGIASSAIWFIRPLVMCIAIVAGLKALSLFGKNRVADTIITSAWLAGLAIVVSDSASANWLHLLLFVLPAFCCGIIVNGLLRIHEPRAWITALSALGLLAAGAFGVLPDLFCFLAAYPVLWLGTRNTLPATLLNRVPDVSYGIYLFNWPAAQLARALLGPGWNGYALAMLAMPLALALGSLTWLLAERPIARWRTRLVANRAARVPPVGKAKRWERSQPHAAKMTSRHSRPSQAE
ncbi:MAG: acyltransferase family protein [Alphaproteobacteria bacterium]|nr:acyltransferase family protein [Alphaproteobacteria bacterium]